MADWKEHRLGDLIDVKHGFAFKGEFISNEPTDDILVTPGNFHIGGGFKATKFKYYDGDYPSDYVLNAGDVVVTMTDLSQEGDTLGYAAKIPTSDKQRYLHNQRIGLVQIISEEADKDFIHWLMRTRDYQGYIVGAASGTAIRHTSPTSIKEFEFLLPPLVEQRAIAEVLSNFDDKINLLVRQNETLGALGETLFRQRFVEEAEEGWETKRLDDFFPVITGKKDANYGSEDGIYPFFTCSQKILKCDYYSFEGHAILLAGNGDFNLKRYKGRFEAYQRTYVLIPSEEKYVGFLFNLMKHFLDEMTSGAQGSVISFLTKGMITQFEFKFPRVEPQADLKELNSINEHIDSNAAQIRTLTQLRDGLLPQLMSRSVQVNL